MLQISSNLMKSNIRILALSGMLVPLSLFAQGGAKWATGGNSTTNGDFIGTTNTQPLIFKTNGIQRMQLTSSGVFQLNSLIGSGDGLVTTDANGNLLRTNYSGNSNEYLGGDGQFHSVSSAGGWINSGNNVYHPSGNVGIGTTSPQYLLDVNGDAWFSGTVYATGVILTNKLLADTMKAGNMFALNNNLHMSAGGINEVYTTTGDLRFQSNAGNSANTIFSAGTIGNVGIGTYNPQYKLDVSGQVRFANDVFVSRLRALPGDSVIKFGDSTMYLNYYLGNIFNNNTSGYRGMGIGVSALGFGLHSTALGYRVRANAVGSIVIGTVDNASTMVNNIPSSLMIGFNSSIPTFFVGPGSGNNTIGNVGIGTTSPQYTLDVNGTINASQLLINGNALPQTLWTVSGNDVFFDLGSASGGSVGIGVNGTNSFYGCPTSVCPNGKYLLAVAGGIRAKSLKIEPTWSDYVFDSTYQLMPLDSVDAYIQANGHLPGVQTAAEVAQNGTDVGETQAMLLAKIEELTLYMIEIQKQNEELKKEVEDMKSADQK